MAAVSAVLCVTKDAVPLDGLSCGPSSLPVSQGPSELLISWREHFPRTAGAEKQPHASFGANTLVFEEQLGKFPKWTSKQNKEMQPLTWQHCVQFSPLYPSHIHGPGTSFLSASRTFSAGEVHQKAKGKYQWHKEAQKQSMRHLWLKNRDGLESSQLCFIDTANLANSFTKSQFFTFVKMGILIVIVPSQGFCEERTIQIENLAQRKHSMNTCWMKEQTYTVPHKSYLESPEEKNERGRISEIKVTISQFPHDR